MSKFVLIDHSLISLGGHHFEYDLHLLQAAEAAGFQPVLTTNLDFAERARLPSHWQVLRLFRYPLYYVQGHFALYPDHCPVKSLRRTLLPDLAGASWWTHLRRATPGKFLKAWRRRRRYRPILDDFEQGCADPVS